MVGMSLGPVTGKIVAQVASGTAPLVDIALLDPQRFG
jgi:glycine/D-amino acid oxidase-like deaminating enzyme